MIFHEIGQASKLCENILHNYSNMAAQTGSTYIHETMIDSVEIPTVQRKCPQMTATMIDNRK